MNVKVTKLQPNDPKNKDGAWNGTATIDGKNLQFHINSKESECHNRKAADIAIHYVWDCENTTITQRDIVRGRILERLHELGG